MRLAALALLLALGANRAIAEPATVLITVSPALQAKAVKTYGVREMDFLTADLRKSVTRELARTGAYDGARLELVLVDAVPNRPTFKELGDKPGLSLESFGIGGAKIEGRAVASDGTITPIGYSYYETDIRQEWAHATWTDAEWTFDRFARQLSRGAALASR